MRRADVREISSGCLNIVMIACNTSFVKSVELLRTHKSHGCAEVDLTFLLHRLISMDRFLKLFSGQCLSGCHDRETVNTFRLIDTAHLHDLFLRKEIINFAVCMMMSRLCAVLAILWTSSAPSVDNRTKVYLISHTCLADPVCSLTELLQIACQKEIQVILSCDSSSVDNLLCQCQCVHNVLLFLILSCLPQTSFTVSRCIISL